MTVYVVADEFTADPGGRFISDGDFSGEEFRERVLVGLVEKAVADNRELHINFDGVTGMPTSFLEEAFGGLFRRRLGLPADQILQLVKVEAPNSPKLWPYVRFAENAMRAQARGN